MRLENPIVVPLRPLGELDAGVILSHLSNVLKSHNDLPLSDSFEIDIGMIDMPKGGHKIYNVQESIHLKNSIVRISNVDSMCLARSLSICFAKSHVTTKSEWDALLDANPLKEANAFNYL